MTKPLKGKVVWYVEDQFLVAMGPKLDMEAAGATVVEFQSVDDVVKALQASKSGERPDLVLTDWRLEPITREQFLKNAFKSDGPDDEGTTIDPYKQQSEPGKEEIPGDAIKIITAMRADKELAKIPVAITTGYAKLALSAAVTRGMNVSILEKPLLNVAASVENILNPSQTPPRS